MAFRNKRINKQLKKPNPEEERGEK